MSRGFVGDLPDRSGQVLGGRYRLLQPLGQGGMATIYAAEHVEIGRRVAIKMLTQTRCAATAHRFLMEARAASQLHHENIIAVTDFGRHVMPDGESVPYLAMEYLDGEDLAVTLEHEGPLHWTRVLTIGKQICRALIAAHAQGIVHCDIKPANCFRIQRDDTADYIKVLDFGVASFACKRTGRCTPDPIPTANPADPGGRRKSGPRLGTPGYMAGELLSGDSYDHRVDIYALGVLMYRLLTNKMPYPAARLYAALDSGPSGTAGPDGSSPRTLTPFPMRRAIPTLEISPAFEAVVLRALAQDPEQRHPTARDLYAALVAAEQSTLRPAPPRDSLHSPHSLHPVATLPEPRAGDSASLSTTETSRATLGAPGSSSTLQQRTAADLTPSGSWQAWRAARSRRGDRDSRGAPAWTALSLRATLALALTTVAVRAAWSLMS